MSVQAVVYERRTGHDMGEFLASTAGKLSSPVLVSMLDALENARRTWRGTPTVGGSAAEAGACLRGSALAATEIADPKEQT